MEGYSIPKWVIELRGHSFDLEELVDMFTEPGLRVIKIKDSYYLESSKLEDSINVVEINEYAKSILMPTINGYMKVCRSDYHDVAIKTVGEIADDGSIKHYAFITLTEHIRSHITASVTKINADGTIDKSQEPTMMARGVPILLENELVSEALRLFNSGPENWGTLYKVFEIIESDVGRKNFEHIWITKSEKQRFTQTANSREAIGDEARHAVRKVPAPQNPMTIVEATRLIKTLINRWIEEKVAAV